MSKSSYFGSDLKSQHAYEVCFDEVNPKDCSIRIFKEIFELHELSGLCKALNAAESSLRRLNGMLPEEDPPMPRGQSGAMKSDYDTPIPPPQNRKKRRR
jgi:hypothetical protein